MYRHLAHAPAFLQRLEAALKPVDADSSLERMILGNKAVAYERSRFLARAIEAPMPEQATVIEEAVGAFVDHAIGKMVTICRAIRVARGVPSSLAGSGRGRDARYRAPPAQNPACPIKAPGSHLG
jgi:hypothetical protein